MPNNTPCSMECVFGNTNSIGLQVSYNSMAVMIPDTPVDFNKSHLSPFFEIGKICFTSVRKFKGMEAKVIFLIDISLKEFLDNDFLQRLYIGCSRATHELHIFINDINSDTLYLAIESILPGTKRKRNKKTLEDLLNASWSREEEYV